MNRWWNERVVPLYVALEAALSGKCGRAFRSRFWTDRVFDDSAGERNLNGTPHRATRKQRRVGQKFIADNRDRSIGNEELTEIIIRNNRCADCRGTGLKPDAWVKGRPWYSRYWEPRTCPTCEGRGYVLPRHGGEG